MKNHLLQILFFFSPISVPLLPDRAIAQTSKVWPSAIDYKLKGNVKSWTMKNKSGIVRQQTFNSERVLIKDTYKGTPQTFTQPENLPEKLKIIFEATSSDRSKRNVSFSINLFNEQGKLLEKRTPNQHETNKFTTEGKIAVHKQTQTIMQIRAWSSTGHPKSTYSFTDTVCQIVIYKYNAFGSIKEFELYNSDPFKNIRMVYDYDSDNHLIESNRYDSYNIPSKLKVGKYLTRFIDSDIDSNFSINHFYNTYWSQGSPVKQTWKYNENGERIEYIVYGNVNDPSFRSTWEYDNTNTLIKEIHYDVYHNSIRSIIGFDKQGNVTKETDFDYWNKKQTNFYYQIKYY